MEDHSPKWRYEYKYRISRATSQALASVFRTLGLVPDPYSDLKNGEYSVSSVYFDSPFLTDYYDKAGGFSYRKKIRGRIYSPWENEESKEVRLEIKWRHEQLIAKDTVLLARREWGMLLNGEYSQLLSLPFHERDSTNLKKALWYIIRDSMRPMLMVRYLRRPMILQGDRMLRVTFDHDITACETRDFWYTPFVAKVLPEDEVIMEVKFADSLPRWFRDIMHSFNLTRISYSKYAAGMDAVRLVRPLAR